MMKAYFFIFFGFTLCFGQLWAQQPQAYPTKVQTDYNSPEYKAALSTNHLIQELGLTGEQREKVYCAKLSFLQKKQALIRRYETEGGGSMAARLELYEYRKQSEREIRSALTGPQQKLFDAYLDRIGSMPHNRY